MESIINSINNSLSEIAARSLSDLATVAAVSQLLILALAVFFAVVARRRWQQFIQIRIGSEEVRDFKRIVLRGIDRIVAPLTAALVAIVGGGILSKFNVATNLINVLVPLIFALAIIRALVYALRRAYGTSPSLRAMEGMIAAVVWGVVALYLLGWLPGVLAALDKPGITLGDTRFSFLTVSKFSLAVVAFVVLAQWISRQIEKQVTRTRLLSATMQVGLVKFSNVVLYSVALLIALDTVGIDLTTLAVFGGALGVGLGFGLQRVTSNFISGFILLFDRSIKPGDVISVGTRFGWVVALHARYIVVRDRDGVETLIPNENLITSEVTNWSYTDRHVRIKLPVQISYNDDPEEAMQLILDTVQVSDRILKTPAPQARLLSFGDNGINLELRIWLDDPEEGMGSVKSDINLAIWRIFKENGITIPFPQRDVRLVDETGK
ncbi:MAG: mechanosensitive ion channel domain-containing protein [Acidiferrobacterales bacterium]